MKINQLTASAFADQIGVQRSSVSHVLSGRNKPSLEFIQKVLDSFPRVDANWLINGSTKGASDKEDYSNRSVSQETTQQQTVTATTNTQETEELSSDIPTIKRILIFYSDNTFEEFKP